MKKTLIKLDSSVTGTIGVFTNFKRVYEKIEKDFKAASLSVDASYATSLKKFKATGAFDFTSPSLTYTLSYVVINPE